MVILKIPRTAINALEILCTSRSAWWSFSRAGLPADKKALSDPFPFMGTTHVLISFSHYLGLGNSCPFHLLRAPWSHRTCRSWLLREVASRHLTAACVVLMNVNNIQIDVSVWVIYTWRTNASELSPFVKMPLDSREFGDNQQEVFGDSQTKQTSLHY